MEERNDDETAWARAREVFLDCLEMDEPGREAFLAGLDRSEPELARWVRRLLAQDARSGTDRVPEKFGPYAILRRIATGGMGEVYLGRRVDGEFEREVAIKLLKPRLDSEHMLRRFQRERRTLATLDHEYIARLYDGGTTDAGQPYLVLEYVDGVPLDEYCRRNAVDLRAALTLFLRVLAAVGHAHERGVVHRDLKPGNILVRADGTPRLLDFGIARAPEDEAESPEPLTRTGQRLFTPEYASPEQVLGRDVSPASDVFALGVLLYRLLTGSLPWKAELSQHDLERAIVEVDPEPPSRRETGTARRRIAGDLDTIVLKCLSKEPERRYANASALAADIELHLGGFPIHARRAGALERAWRFGRRKPWTLVASAALFAVLLTGVWAWRLRGAQAESRVELLAAVRDRLDAARDERGQGRLDRARTTLDFALTALDDFPDESILRAEVLTQLGVVANHASQWAVARGRFAEARLLLEPLRAEAPRPWASLLNGQAYALSGLGLQDDARRVADAALVHACAHLERSDELWLDTVLEYSVQAMKRGEVAASLESMQAAVRERRALALANDTGLAQLRNAESVALYKAGRAAEAFEPLEEALAIYGWHFGEGHREVAQLRVNLGDYLFAAGRHAEAEAQYVLAVAVHESTSDDFNLSTAWMRLGEVSHARGESALALERLRQSEAHMRAIVADSHPSVRKLAHVVGRVQADAGDLAAARASLEFALDPPHGVQAYGAELEERARLDLGRVLIMLGEDEAGRAEYRRVLQQRTKRLGGDHALTCAVRELLDGR